MQRIIGILLLLCGMSFACSPLLTSEFCNEIDYWNIQSSKYNYKYFEISPNWLLWIDGYKAFNFTIRF